MYVASLELCKELYKLSGWQPDHWQFKDGSAPVPTEPAYDLGYMLRKLTPYIDGLGELTTHLEIRPWDNEQGAWGAHYSTDYKYVLNQRADTPENAACKLAIELFRQGVLT